MYNMDLCACTELTEVRREGERREEKHMGVSAISTWGGGNVAKRYPLPYLPPSVGVYSISICCCHLGLCVLCLNPSRKFTTENNIAYQLMNCLYYRSPRGAGRRILEMSSAKWQAIMTATNLTGVIKTMKGWTGWRLSGQPAVILLWSRSKCGP